MGFDEMLTPGRTCVGDDDTHGRGADGGHDLLPCPHLLLGEEDGAPPIICRDGIKEEDAGSSWMSHSGKKKRGESSPSGPDEVRGFRTEEKRAMAGQAAVAGSLSRLVCSRCGTSRTPMWRSGPAGPKTLCNACGIRYRKMRRSGGPSSSTAASSAGDDPQKQDAAAAAAEEEEEAREQGEKLRRRQRRRREVLWMLLRESRRFSFRCDEEEAEAAVLLMAISSGLFVHTSH